MRILMLTQFYPPIMGGIELHVQSLSEALSKRGHEVSVVTFRHPGQAEFELDGPVKIFRVRSTLQQFRPLFTTERFHAPPFPDPAVMVSLRRIIRQEKPQIIHAHNWIVHSFLPLKAWSKAKLVMTLHDCELTCVQIRNMYMDRTLCSGPAPIKCLKCAAHHYGAVKGVVTQAGNWVMHGYEQQGVDMFLPVSQAVAAANGLCNGRLPQENVQVISNFVPDDVSEQGLENEPAPFDQFPGTPFILQVGDLVPDKGIFVLLEAYQELHHAPPLVLIGRQTPESPTELPDNVVLIPGLPHAEVMRAWQRSLFGVVPSLCLDASPTVTLEAMACGRPVIGSAIGGIMDQVVDGETGFLTDPGDVIGLRDTMQRMIDEPGLRQRMGLAARVRVKEFLASAVVSRIENVYQTLLEPELSIQ